MSEMNIVSTILATDFYPLLVKARTNINAFILGKKIQHDSAKYIA